MSNSTKLSAKERKRLQAILDSSYGDAFVNGSLAGGLGLGALASVWPTTYAMTDLNPFRNDDDREAVKKLNRQNILGFGTAGFVAGAPIGGMLNTARLMLQKRKARKLLGKTAALQDYALNGGVGTALGVGSGMLMNWALGRKLLDKKLILGGALAGGGIGTAVGSLKSQLRKGYDATQRTLQDCVQKDSSGKVIRKKLISGELGKDAKFEYSDDGLAQLQDGVYYIKEHDAGAKNVPGSVQAVHDTMGHDIIVLISSRKLNPAKYFTGSGDSLKEHNVNMFQLKNGQWCMTYELCVGRKDPNGGKIRDSHGNEWDQIDSTSLNGFPLGNVNDKFPNPEKIRHAADDDAYNSDTGHGWLNGAERLIEAASGEFKEPNFLAYKLTDNPDYNSEAKLQGVMQSMVSHAVQRDGRLTPWAPGGPIVNRVARALGMRSYDPATCMEYAKWIVKGLQSEDLLPQKLSPTYSSDKGAILMAAPFATAGNNPFGTWEKYQDILARQQRGESDPELTGTYYYDPYYYNASEGFQWIKDRLNKFKSGLHINTNTGNNNG